MTPEQKHMVQTSFEKVKPISDTAAALFYSRLFELDPQLEQLFHGSLEEQGRQLMHMIGLATKGLNRPDELLPLLHGLGARHAGYGVEERDYDTVGQALLWTLERGLGDSFTAEVREAWIAVYALLAETMQAGARKILVVNLTDASESTTCTGGDRKGWRGYFPAAAKTTLRRSETEMKSEETYETLTGRFADTLASFAMTIGFIVLLTVTAQAAAFHVTNTNDSGAGSLREAISQSNLNDTTGNLIDFQIMPAGGVKTIALQSGLPEITVQVTIDGTTQPGYAGSPMIELDGTDAGAGATGLTISAGNSTVKGLVINRFNGIGIVLQIAGQNVIAGNYFGLDHTGTLSLPLNGPSLYVTTSGNTIGGVTSAARNIISGANNRGIWFNGNEASGNLVQGNYVGTDATGTIAIGNSAGITFYDAPGNVVGGMTAAERNVISGNGNAGISIEGPNAEKNVIKGNYVGTKADGISNLTNGYYGIYIGSGALSNSIGGIQPGEGNVVAFHYREIALASDAGSGNCIRGNSIFSTGQIAVDLADDAETANDTSDADTGPNDLQNYPVITLAVASNSTVSLAGTLNSAAGKQFTIDLYCNATLNSEGRADAKTYLTTVSTVTDGGGSAGFNTTVPLAALTGQYITATATSENNSTSELSGAEKLTGGNGILQFSAANYSVNENGGSAMVMIKRTGGGFGAVSVAYTTGNGTAKRPADYAEASGTLVWADGDISDKTFNVTIDDDNLAEQNETINLILSNPVGGATLGAQGAAVITINDNEPPANPADLVVTNTNDGGPGSLRQAILASNALAGKDTISFNIQPSGAKTIIPLSSLPEVADPVTIDGTTQPGFVDIPIVEINGASAGPNSNGFTLSAGNSTVRGFVINRFSQGSGIFIDTNGDNVITGNFIGTNLAGTSASANGAGVLMGSSHNRIGGTTVGERNVISGNINSGVGIDGYYGPTTGNKVMGNYLGTNTTGTAPIGNHAGVSLSQSEGNTIGGSSAASRNLISGNSVGVLIGGSGLTAHSNDNKVQGNFVGTAANGTGSVGNTFLGVLISNGSNNLIGGTNPGEENVIAFNGGLNGGGVLIEAGGSEFKNAILGNSIFSNKGLGIDLGGNGVTANDQGDGDTGGNTANEYQNYPVLTAAIANGSNTDIKGTLNSPANTQFRLEFFSSLAADPSSFGEGQKFLGATTVITDANGNATFTLAVPTAAIVGEFLTSTATDPNNNTSEFSEILSLQAIKPGNLQFSASSYTVNESSGNAVVTVTRTGGSNGAVSVKYATSDGLGNAKANAPADYTATNGTVSFADGETIKTVSIPIIDDNLIENDENFLVNLGNPTNGATVGAQQSTMIFISDNDFPSLSIGDVSQAEGNTGASQFVFNVTLSASSPRSIAVQFATSANGGSANASDFLTAAGSVTFDPGETSKPVSVTVYGDATDESNETFFVNLSNPSQASIAKAQGTGTIINDDAPGGPGFGFSQPTYSGAEQLGAVSVTITRSGDTSGPASVDYSTADASAMQKSDYEISRGALRFAPGEASKTISVLINQDSYVEGPESFNVVLSNPTGAALGQSNSTVNITDDVVETVTNPIDDPQSFVHMHYHDFLNREPDPSGLQFWTNQISACGQNAACAEAVRINVSAAYFLSIEFQQTGYLLHLFQKESFGSLPKYYSFMRDLQEVSQGVVVNSPGWQQKLADNQQQFAETWVNRAAFKATYDPMSNTNFVNALYSNAGVIPPQAERDGLVTALDMAMQTRAAVLLEVAANTTFRQQEQNPAFVLMQYFGYLRRDPDAGPDSDLSGYYFWLTKLNNFNGNYQQAEMVKAFLSSTEYRARFGQQ